LSFRTKEQEKVSKNIDTLLKTKSYRTLITYVAGLEPYLIDHPYTYTKIAEAFLRVGKFIRAQKFLYMAAISNPRYYKQSMMKIAKISEQRKDYENAKRIYHELLTNTPQKVEQKKIKFSLKKIETKENLFKILYHFKPMYFSGETDPTTYFESSFTGSGKYQDFKRYLSHYGSMAFSFKKPLNEVFSSPENDQTLSSFKLSVIEKYKQLSLGISSKWSYYQHEPLQRQYRAILQFSSPLQHDYDQNFKVELEFTRDLYLKMVDLLLQKNYNSLPVFGSATVIKLTSSLQFNTGLEDFSKIHLSFSRRFSSDKLTSFYVPEIGFFMRQSLFGQYYFTTDFDLFFRWNNDVEHRSEKIIFFQKIVPTLLYKLMGNDEWYLSCIVQNTLPFLSGNIEDDDFDENELRKYYFSLVLGFKGYF